MTRPKSRFGLALSAALISSPGISAEYDGIYRPDFDWAKDWDYETVGSDGGALAVRDGIFYGVENRCDLTNPVTVRDMDATLYDAECTGEGESYSYRVMLMTTPTGIGMLVRDGGFSPLRRCE